MIRRREFIAGLGGAAAWPLAAHAQQVERIGGSAYLFSGLLRAMQKHCYVSAFESSWRELGWVDGRNIRVDYHWAPGDAGVFEVIPPLRWSLRPQR